MIDGSVKKSNECRVSNICEAMSNVIGVNGEI